jgi:hypothetical protein
VFELAAEEQEREKRLLLFDALYLKRVIKQKVFLFDERKHSYYEAVFAFKAINFHFCSR